MISEKPVDLEKYHPLQIFRFQFNLSAITVYQHIINQMSFFKTIIDLLSTCFVYRLSVITFLSAQVSPSVC